MTWRAGITALWAVPSIIPTENLWPKIISRMMAQVRTWQIN